MTGGGRRVGARGRPGQQDRQHLDPDTDRDDDLDRDDGRGREHVAERGEEPDDAEGDERRAVRATPPRRSIPIPAPIASATATITTSSASLSFVPNRLTTKSFAPGGWWSMIHWPIAATREVAPGRRPAISSETPRAAATATIPASAVASPAGPGGGGIRRRGGAAASTGGCRPAKIVAGYRSCRPHVGPADDDPVSSGSARSSGPRSSRPRAAVRMPRTGPRPAGPRRSARRPPRGPRAGRARGRTRRDLLEVVGDEHDRPRPVSAASRPRSRSSSSRAARSRLRRRLVEEEQVRVGHERSSDRGPPALPGRERLERLVDVVAQADAAASAPARSRSASS